MNLDKIVTSLSQLSENDRNKGIKLILKIFKNITKHPNNLKYQDLNSSTIYEKFKTSDIFVDLLLNAGFQISNDGKRMQYDMTQINKLKLIQNQLLIISQTYYQSVHHGTTHQQKHFSQKKHSSLIQNKSFVSSSCIGSVQHCQHLNELIIAMNKYQQLGVNDDINQQDILLILEHYLHLMYRHDNNKDFEYIVNQFVFCDINKCIRYKRNVRDRHHFISDQVPSVSIEILDKIHCYFMHSYDIGYRLTMQETKIINQDEKQTNDEEYSFVNEKIKKLKQIISDKRNNCNVISQTTNTRISQRAEQLLIHKTEKSNSNERGQYSIGILFYYGFDGERKVRGLSNPIKPKYNSLKEELTSNTVAILAMQQFINEYKKAEIHFQSKHCQTTFPERIEYEWEGFLENYKEGPCFKWEMSIELLLAVMVYCNYTQLQYEFSKTYRTCWKDCKSRYVCNHDEFYHLGRNIKISVYKFGTEFGDGNVNTLYHGVGELLKFKHHHAQSNGVIISAPLSTTSSREVALIFANNNNGIVVEFIESKQTIPDHSCKYLSVAWLSDYPNEKEYLFVQNNKRLEIQNILDLNTGIEYCLILEAIKYIHTVTTRQIISDNASAITISDGMKELMIAIIHHQLSVSDDTYKPFTSLTSYALQIINDYFETNRGLYIKYAEMKIDKFQFLFDIFCYEKHEWIKLQNITSLFYNAPSIIVELVELTEFVFEDIVVFMRKDVFMKCELNLFNIHFKVNKIGNHSNDDGWNEIFKTMGYKITINSDRALVIIKKIVA